MTDMSNIVSTTAVLERTSGSGIPNGTRGGLALPPLILLVGLVVLYLPTYYSLSQTFWNTEEQGHGPLILAVAIYLTWTKRSALAGEEAEGASAVAAWAMLVTGLLFYILGRSQGIILFEAGSQILVFGATAAFLGGRTALRALAFPLFFLIFMLPLPGVVVDAITGPLKHNVSAIAEYILYGAGYPIARHGVVLTIGQYQLLVADACSGLHSMFSLSALGLLYLYLMRHTNVVRNGVLILSILPIAFAANIIRVMVLVLVTYHFGDEAGQGFIHGFAGMALFVIALLIIFVLDGVLGFFAKDRPSMNRTEV